MVTFLFDEVYSAPRNPRFLLICHIWTLERMAQYGYIWRQDCIQASRKIVYYTYEIPFPICSKYWHNSESSYNNLIQCLVTRFRYMAVSDDRQRVMPTIEDRERGRALAYPEAVLLKNPSNDKPRLEVSSPFTCCICILVLFVLMSWMKLYLVL